MTISNVLALIAALGAALAGFGVLPDYVLAISVVILAIALVIYPK